MDNNANTLTRLVDILIKGASGAIVLPANPTADAVAAGCALYLGLTKLGKTVSLICANPPADFDLVALDKIQSQFAIQGDNLVVSFPYTDGSIDKVDYNIQGNNFNLIITPRPGYPKLDQKQVVFNYAGGTVDYIIVIDSATLNNLGPIYAENQNQFQGKDIVNIDRHLTNSFFGTVNFVNKTSSSVCELILKILQALKVEVDRDIATNLYGGIAAATNNFGSYSVSAETFENVAILMRMGAIKKMIKKQASQSAFHPTQPEIDDDDDYLPPTQFSQSMRFPQTPQKPKPVQSPAIKTQSREKQAVKPIGEVEKESTDQEQAPPQDWLKPKIFRGGGGMV